jgi:prepilin-type N-terminal cleavage/methylation domain-containing protein
MPDSAAPDHTSRHLTRFRRTAVARAGFTLPEILIVVVLISILALLAIPRFSSANGRRHMESARMRVAAALATARQGAIQKGQTVQFKIANNRVTVTEGLTDLLSPVPLDTLYDVRIVSPSQPITIDFSARGFAVGLGLAENHLILRRPGVGDDTVTISRTGMVKP